jgi:hypothetical protein
MASNFDTIFADSGVPALMESLGSSVTYNDPEEDAVALTAIVGHTEVIEEADGAASGGRRKRYVREVIVARDEEGTYGGVATPKLSATLTIDGEDWAVEAIEAQSASTLKLRCVRKTVSEQSRAGYRAR